MELVLLIAFGIFLAPLIGFIFSLGFSVLFVLMACIVNLPTILTELFAKMLQVFYLTMRRLGARLE